MLNIGKLGKGQENYYLESVADGADDYYVRSGESPGYWLGSAISLSGTVTSQALKSALDGADPRDGNRLRHRKTGPRVPGFDLTFRSPKSVSLLYALSPDRETRAKVRQAHDTAVAAALGYMERRACFTRRRNSEGEITTIKGSGFLAAAFRHRISRAGDPLLHTHVLVSNLTQTGDGWWGALDARHIYAHAKTAGYLYQAELRRELTRLLGVEWEPVRNGTADIAGIPRKVIKAFSKRRGEIEDAMQLRGTFAARAAQVATLLTRKAKDYKVTPEGLLPEWKARAAELGLGESELQGLLRRSEVRDVSYGQTKILRNEMVSPEGLTRDSSSFSRRDVIQGFCEGTSFASVTDIESFSDRFLSSEQVLPLAVRSEDVSTSEFIRRADGTLVFAVGGELRFSTPEMLRTEERVIERALSRSRVSPAVASKASVDSALSRRPSLSSEQRTMVRRLCTDGAGVQVVVGKAGTGKTFALDAAREAWQSSGHHIIGCSLAARAAKELEHGSGIRSYTVDGLLLDLEHGRYPLPSSTVIVVDEAAMVGTRKLDRLLSHAEVASAKVVLVGDDRQLPEIAAGGAFRGIKNRSSVIELTEVRRQEEEWERKALDHLRSGSPARAIEEYKSRHRVTLRETAEETRDSMLGDWWESRSKGKSSVMIAARRSDVADLNARARALMRSSGQLGKKVIEIEGQVFAVGDRVMATKNAHGIRLFNGTAGIIHSIDSRKHSLTMVTDDGEMVELPRTYLDAGHLTHAYAVTGHKAQGMTVDEAFVLGDDTMYREWGYVAMSRGRERNRLYVVAAEDVGRDEVGGAVDEEIDPMEELIRALARSRSKQLAIDESELLSLKHAPTAELEKERRSLQGLMREMPPDNTRKLRQLEDRKRELEGMRSREAEKRKVAEAKLSKIGALARKRRRDEVRDLEKAVASASRAESAFTGQLQTIATQLDEFRRSDTERQEWVQANAHAVARYTVVKSEISHRRRTGLKAAEVAAEPYLKKAVGETPLSPAARRRWSSGVSTVETFRAEHQIEDRVDPFKGVRSNDAERRRVEASIEEVMDRDSFGRELS